MAKEYHPDKNPEAGEKVSTTSHLQRSNAVLYYFDQPKFSNLIIFKNKLITLFFSQFKEISFAYEVLSNPEKKETYDRFGLQGLKEGGGGSGIEWLLSLLNIIFVFERGLGIQCLIY